MRADHFIPATEFCTHHHIEVSFIESLHDYGLIQLTTIDGAGFINEDELFEVERLMRLHYDLQINFEGIDVVKNLLQHIEALEEKMNALKNRLRLYESDNLT